MRPYIRFPVITLIPLVALSSCVFVAGNTITIPGLSDEALCHLIEMAEQDHRGVPKDIREELERLDIDCEEI